MSVKLASKTSGYTVAILAIILLIIIIPLTVFAVSQVTKLAPKAANKSVREGVENNTRSDDVISTKGRFVPQDKPVAKVNDVTIYNKDLNCYIFSHKSEEFINFKTEYNTLYENATKGVIDETITQLSYYKTYVPINSGNDCEQRTKRINDAIDLIGKSQKKIDVSLITVWYYNVTAPTIPLEQARLMAYNKISDIYKKLKAGTITVAEAESLIKTDQALKQLDSNYAGNALTEFTDVSYSTPPFTYKILNDALGKLSKAGDISPILWNKGKIAEPTSTEKDEKFYAIIKLNKVTTGGKGYLEWLSDESNKYSIVKL